MSSSFLKIGSVCAIYMLHDIMRTALFCTIINLLRVWPPTYIP